MSEPAASPRRIMIVEDEALIAEDIEESLEAMGLLWQLGEADIDDLVLDHLDLVSTELEELETGPVGQLASGCEAASMDPGPHLEHAVLDRY